jgi:hypothetical protein
MLKQVIYIKLLGFKGLKKFPSLSLGLIQDTTLLKNPNWNLNKIIMIKSLNISYMLSGFHSSD